MRIRVKVIKGKYGFILRAWDYDTNRALKERTAESNTRKGAVREAGKWEEELNDARTPCDRITWDAFCQRYQDESIATLAESTQGQWWSVRAKLEAFRPLRWLDEIDEAFISKWISWALNQDGLASASVGSYLKRIRHMLGWAVGQRLLAAVPTINRPKKVRKKASAKGRPLTHDEFRRLLRATRKLFPKGRTARELRRILRGLYWSSLRLNELLAFRWDDRRTVTVLNLDKPELGVRIWIPAQHNAKQGETVEIGCAWEFERLLKRIPPEKRKGRPFVIHASDGGVFGNHWVEKLICKVGRESGVEVHYYENGEVKYASAHDLRRSFAQRWADREMPAHQLHKQMRHEDFETTLQYYLNPDVKALYERMRRKPNA